LSQVVSVFTEEECKTMNGYFDSAVRRGCNVLAALMLAALLSGCNLGYNLGEDDSLPRTMTLTAQVITPSEVQLEWTDHTEAVSGYDLYRNGVAVSDTHVLGTSYPDTGVQPNTR
jgi:hypothetical protein